MVAESPVDGKPTTSRHNRRAPAQIDQRFAIARRVRELTEVFRARIPDADDPITGAAIRRAAETTALSEQLRARMLNGETVSADDVLRASRTADLLTRRLRLDHQRKPTAPSLSLYLAARNESTP